MDPITDSHSTSTELLQKVVSGSEDAWTTFFTLYRGLIVSRCISLGVGRDDCSDIVQTVLTRVCSGIQTFRRDCPDHGLRRWLRTITRHVIVDHFRSLPQERCGYSEVELTAARGALSFNSEMDSTVNLPDALLVSKLLPIVDLVRLNYEHRTWEAFWRTAIEGEATADVAEDLQLSPGTIRQARHKILKHLRGEFRAFSEML